MMIRRMEETDLEQVVAIEEASFSQPWSRTGFLSGLKRKDNVFLVLEDEGIQGYLDMYCCMGEGEITNVAVAPGMRKKGYGSLLMKAALEKAQELSLESIVLEVRVSNVNAIALYEKFGFRKLGIRKDFYEFPREDAFVMSLILE